VALARRTLFLSAAIAVLAGIATISLVIVVNHRTPPSTPEQQAGPIRARAFEACRAGEWGECMTRLDEARGLDPAGEKAPAVVQARRALEGAASTDPK
jgi:hypothetical protein